MKNVDPYAESEMVKEASQYSRAWRDVKYKPRITVTISPVKACEWLFSIRLWWAHVTVTPDANRIMVFRRGTWKGLNAIIPAGGHWRPISIDGAKLLWKKAQKNEKKNKISDVINKIIPHRRPLDTTRVWSPWWVPSRLISRHHWIQVRIRAHTPNANKFMLNSWNHFTIPDVIIKAARAPVRGHGLWSTRWNGWFLLIIINEK